MHGAAHAGFGRQPSWQPSTNRVAVARASRRRRRRRQKPKPRRRCHRPCGDPILSTHPECTAATAKAVRWLPDDVLVLADQRPLVGVQITDRKPASEVPEFTAPTSVQHLVETGNAPARSSRRCINRSRQSRSVSAYCGVTARAGVDDAQPGVLPVVSILACVDGAVTGKMRASGSRCGVAVWRPFGGAW